MKLYFDTCSLQRPLDDKAFLRIQMEAEVMLVALDLVKAGRLDLVSSDALIFEIEKTPHRARRDFALETIGMASYFISISAAIEARARVLNNAASSR